MSLAPAPVLTAPTFDECLNSIRAFSAKELNEQLSDLLSEHTLPQAFIQTLGEADRITALKACLVCWVSAKMVPREMQLRNILADRAGQDSLVYAGTGSGKTLPIAVNILLDDPTLKKITITISPLKRLQITQENDFNSRYGIRTVAINEDSPRDDGWWEKNVFSTMKTIHNPVRHLIVTVEQLFKTPAGHWTKLGELIRKQEFQRLISRVNVDEAHFIFTAGQELYGLPPFRPAWGRLNEIKTLLPESVSWHFFSATFPPHILTAVTKLLKPGYKYIHTTSNRPNIIYATHQVENSIEDLHNYECFLTFPFNFATQPHVLIFVDDKKLTTKISAYLEARLPPQERSKGVVRHYHSLMSQMYLEQTHAAFTSNTGTCRILVATSGQSVGVDFPNVKIVCTVGLPSNIVDALQRGGRAIRTGNEQALFVVFFEPWALEIDQAEYMSSGLDQTDPDRPRDVLRKNAQRRDRAPYSSIQLIQSTTCLRKFYASYLNDDTPSAIEYTSPFCCDRHEDEFKLQDFLPGKIWAPSGMKRKDVPTSQAKYRPKGERNALDDKLIEWLSKVLEDDPLMRASYDILTDSKRKTLIRIPSKDIASPATIVHALNETTDWAEEWAEQIFQLIRDHDSMTRAAKLAASVSKAATTRAAKRVVTGFINSTADDFINPVARNTKKART